jgi:hypothetical protein
MVVGRVARQPGVWCDVVVVCGVVWYRVVQCGGGDALPGESWEETERERERKRERDRERERERERERKREREKKRKREKEEKGETERER